MSGLLTVTRYLDRRSCSWLKSHGLAAKPPTSHTDLTAPPDESIWDLIESTADSMEGSKSAATSALASILSGLGVNGLDCRAHPVSFSCPPRIPTVRSLSRGEPKGTNCSSLLSRNNRFVVSSNRFVMWSSESEVPYFEFFSFSVVHVSLVHRPEPAQAHLQGMRALSG